MILSIDPSVNNIGVCLYDKITNEICWKLLRPPKFERVENTLVWIKKYLEKMIGVTIHKENEIALNFITEVVCEMPQFFNSNKGAVAATKGYTLDLACICGYLAGICKFAKPYYYLPIQWKGNVPKRGMIKRFERLFPNEKTPSEHECESVLLLNYHLQQEHGKDLKP